MAVTVTTEAESRQLTTVGVVKGILGVSSAKFDAEIERLIATATDAIEEYVGHVYAKQTYVETVSGSAHPTLLLTNVPIIGIPTVICDSSPVDDFIVEDPLVGSLYRQVGWHVAGWVGWGTEGRDIYGTRQLNYTVTYEAGYLLPGQADRNLPRTVEQACVESVVSWMKQQKRDPTVKSKKVGDLSITYGEETEHIYALPSSATALLSRRVS